MIWMPKPAPYVGERRVVRRFAWWPVTLVNGARLWLESYYALEEWTTIRIIEEFDTWEDHAWRTLVTLFPRQDATSASVCASCGHPREDHVGGRRYCGWSSERLDGGLNWCACTRFVPSQRDGAA